LISCSQGVCSQKGIHGNKILGEDDSYNEAVEEA